MIRFAFGALLAAGGVFLLAVALLGHPVMAHAGAMGGTGLLCVAAGCLWVSEVER